MTWSRLTRFERIAIVVASVLGALLLLALSVLGFWAYVTGEPGQASYLERRGDRIVLAYRECPDERVWGIGNVKVTDTTAEPHVVLWRIRRTGDVDVTTIPLGEVPAGFTEVVPYRAPDPGHVILVESDGTAPFPESIAFRPYRLVAGTFVDGDGLRPSAALDRRGRSVNVC